MSKERLRSQPSATCKQARVTPLPRFGLLLTALVFCELAPAYAQSVAFKHPMDNSPIELQLLPGEKVTGAVTEFHATGHNRYRTDAAAVAEGKELYERHCQSCHLPEGSGRLGPSLTSGDWKYKRVENDIGMFEVIYAGAAGAMQSFFRRGVTQDETLKMIAYVRTLKKPGDAR